MAYIPFGTVPMLVGTQALTSFIYIPFLNKGIVKTCEADAGDLVLSHWTKYLKTKADVSPFKEIAPHFRAFVSDATD